MLRFPSLFIISALLISCNGKDKQFPVTHNKQQYKFYDFNIAITLYNRFLGVERKILIANNGLNLFDERDRHISQHNLQPETLYLINYQRDENKGVYNQNKIVSTDTLKVHLSKSQLDTIYSLAT